MNDVIEVCKVKLLGCCKVVAGYSGIAFSACLNNFRVSPEGASVAFRNPSPQFTLPDEDVANRFNEYLDGFDLPITITETVRQLPLDHKRNFIADDSKMGIVFNKAVEILQKVSSADGSYYSKTSIDSTIEVLNQLNVILRTRVVKNCLSDFVSAKNGLACLDKILRLDIYHCCYYYCSGSNNKKNFCHKQNINYNNNYQTNNRYHSCLLYTTLNLVKSVLNDKESRETIFNLQQHLIFALCKVASNVKLHDKCRTLLMHILGGLCLYENGHELVLKFSEELDNVEPEGLYFQKIATTTIDNERPNLPKIISVLSFFNALLNGGELKQNLTRRVEMRSKILSSGFAKVFGWLKTTEVEHPTLLDHLDLFVMTQQEDDELVRESLDFVEEIKQMGKFAEVSRSLHLTERDLNCLNCLNISKTLLNILDRTIDDREIGIVERKLDELVQKCSVQFYQGQITNYRSTKNADPIAKSDYDVLLEKCQHLEEKLSETEKILVEMQEEKQQQLKLSQMSGSQEDVCSLSAVSTPSSTMSSSKCSSASDEGIVCSPTETFMESPPNFSGIVGPLASIAAKQKAELLTSTPPAPPPIPSDFASLFVPKKLMFRSQKSIIDNHLKGLNWTVIPEHKISGSLWEKVGDKENEVSSLMEIIDMELLVRSFTQQANNKRDSIAESIHSLAIFRPLSVIDARRAQNCQIVLSRFKIDSPSILCHTVTRLDPAESISKDMLEQLLKFIPTKDETERLVEAAKNSELTKLDEFFHCLTKYPSYETRLKCLWLRKTFDEKLNEIKSNVSTISTAAKTLQDSSRVHKILHLLLLIGNRLNDGRRIGRAKAFDVEILSKLADVKSTVTLNGGLPCQNNPNRHADYNLLSYLVECCDHRCPDLFRCRKDILAFEEASKTCLAEINADFKTLENGLHAFNKEIKHHELNQLNQAKLNGFLDKSTQSLVDTANLLNDMNVELENCAQLLALDLNQVQRAPNQLFESFAKFLTHFCEMRKHLKEDEHQQQRPTLTLSKVSKTNTYSNRQSLPAVFDRCIAFENDPKKEMIVPKKTNADLDFDDMVSALQSSQVFSQNLNRLRVSLRDKNKRNNQRRPSSTNVTTGLVVNQRSQPQNRFTFTRDISRER